MSKFWKIWTVVTWVLLTTHLAVNYWYWPAKVDQAYDRGKIDGQLLESTVTIPTPDSLVYCGISLLIHSWDESLSYCVLCGREYVLFDSTDTMPAVEEVGDE